MTLRFAFECSLLNNAPRILDVKGSSFFGALECQVISNADLCVCLPKYSLQRSQRILCRCLSSAGILSRTKAKVRKGQLKVAAASACDFEKECDSWGHSAGIPEKKPCLTHTKYLNYLIQDFFKTRNWAWNFFGHNLEKPHRRICVTNSQVRLHGGSLGTPTVNPVVLNIQTSSLTLS